MSNILEQILATKREEIDLRRTLVPEQQLLDKMADGHTPLGFVSALQRRASEQKPGVIAEIKKASPSKGVIRADFNPAAIATSYATANATCLSILTDEQYFQGHDDYLREVRQVVTLPLLRKDFTIDAYQVYEARAMGADCILLIVSALKPADLRDLYALAQSVGLDVLIEVHDAEELAIALTLGPDLIGINNRNLKTFNTNLETTIDLLSNIPAGVVVVTESGISTVADVSRMQANNVHCFLVGEAFMRATDPGQALSDLFG
ncbi:MAG: indole-3-glycerol phosphate synthase TrpC [Candidatus Azotimanducaceae bacterium]|jgi:indole-3-glycerol phosphate synthase|tara:strand:- start:578 stop:1366 length:789 start_codon:yes stop_codon:yes gene_type:complete